MSVLWVLRRFLQIIPLTIAVLVVNFMLIHVAPGDPASALAGENAPPEFVEALRSSYGLDRPLYLQFLAYVGRLVRGDLGYSFAYHRPVLDVIAERLPATLLLVLTALIPAIVLGTLLGAYAANRGGRLRDRVTSSIAVAAYSAPVFWTGMLMILVFANWLGWFPTSGMRSLGGNSADQGWFGATVDVLHHLALPAVALFLVNCPIYMRLTRATMMGVLKEDFLVSAKSIGYPRRTIVYRHALRNSLLPTIATAGISMGVVFGGALLTETVFGWPGIGQLMYNAVLNRDYPVLLGGFLISAISVGVFAALSDIASMVVDPRIRMGGARA